MAENSTDTVLPKSEPRTTVEKVIFWLLWIVLLLPAIVLLIGIGGRLGVGVLLLLPVVIQLGIHGISLKWFLDEGKSFSKSMLMLLGGTGVLYFLALGSCVVMLMSLSGANFH